MAKKILGMDNELQDKKERKNLDFPPRGKLRHLAGENSAARKNK